MTLKPLETDWGLNEDINLFIRIRAEEQQTPPRRSGRGPRWSMTCSGEGAGDRCDSIFVEKSALRYSGPIKRLNHGNVLTSNLLMAPIWLGSWPAHRNKTCYQKMRITGPFENYFSLFTKIVRSTDFEARFKFLLCHFLAGLRQVTWPSCASVSLSVKLGHS